MYNIGRRCKPPASLEKRKQPKDGRKRIGEDMGIHTLLIDYIRCWLEDTKKLQVKPATYDRLVTSIEALESFEIARMPIGSITPFDCEQYVDEVTNSGYALTTIKKQMLIVSAPLTYAFEHHLIPFNPSACMKPPSKANVQKAKKQIVAYTKPEQERLVRVFAQGAYEACDALWLMLETGLRPGEMLALEKDDIHVERKRLHVHATMVNLANRKRSFIQEGAKTETSNRVVPLSPIAISICERIMKNRKEHPFTNKVGSRLSYESMRYQCKQICSDAGVSYHGLHVWRHTFATNQYYKGTDVKILSKILGHSEVFVTYSIYVHLYGDGFEDMLNAVS